MNKHLQVSMNPYGGGPDFQVPKGLLFVGPGSLNVAADLAACSDCSAQLNPLLLLLLLFPT